MNKILSLKSIYSPEGSKLHESQMELLFLLKQFDSLCTENGIRYFLDGGTLLGAVRHHGFIPWDDDIDVLLFPKDYKKLKKVCKSSIEYPFVLQSLESDYNYPFVYPKYRNENCPSGSSNPMRAKYYKYKGVGIDVFHTQQTNTFVARVCNAIYSVFVLNTAYKIHSGSIRLIYTRFMQLLLLKILFPLINLPVKIFGDKNEYHFSLGTPWTRRKMYKNKFFPASMCKFEDAEFPIPKDYDFYLRMAYGNYMEIPTQEQILSTIHNSKYREEIINRVKEL
jgi:lipopolysaccharide cholinephosphotransferase